MAAQAASTTRWPTFRGVVLTSTTRSSKKTCELLVLEGTRPTSVPGFRAGKFFSLGGAGAASKNYHLGRIHPLFDE